MRLIKNQRTTGKAGPPELETSLDFVGAKSLAWESQVLVPPLTIHLL